MATSNELFCVYVKDDVTPKQLITRRVLADNCMPLWHEYPVILMKLRRPNGQGGFFEDIYTDHDCYAIHRRHSGQSGQGTDAVMVTRCRAQVNGQGGNDQESFDITYDDNIPATGQPRQREWPMDVHQAAMGGSEVRLVGYDRNASDYTSLQDDARALDPEQTPLIT